MSDPTDDAIFSAYLLTVIAAAQGTTTEPREREPHLRTLAAMALGAIHAKLAEGFPMGRKELLETVAAMCKAEDPAAADHDDSNAAWMAGSKAGVVLGKREMLDALEKWADGAREEGGSYSVTRLSALRAWIAEQRKAVAP